MKHSPGEAWKYVQNELEEFATELETSSENVRQNVSTMPTQETREAADAYASAVQAAAESLRKWVEHCKFRRTCLESDPLSPFFTRNPADA